MPIAKLHGGPENGIEYLGRYTHKVAISNHRIKSIDDNQGADTFLFVVCHFVGSTYRLENIHDTRIKKEGQHITTVIYADRI